MIDSNLRNSSSFIFDPSGLLRKILGVTIYAQFSIPHWSPSMDFAIDLNFRDHPLLEFLCIVQVIALDLEVFKPINTLIKNLFEESEALPKLEDKNANNST